jgi:hypothetical protein
VSSQYVKLLARFGTRMLCLGLTLGVSACAPTGEDGKTDGGTQNGTEVCAPETTVPQSGGWSGSGIQFSVSSGASLTGRTMIGFSASGPCTPPADGCFETVSHTIAIYATIPIEAGKFSYADDSHDIGAGLTAVVRVAGQFCTSTSAIGTLSYDDGSVVTGDLEWKAKPNP